MTMTDREKSEERRAPIVAMLVAAADNDVIGMEGEMPWRLSTDLKRFKALTMGKPIIMGRKTFESLGKPLPGRSNIVVSRSRSFSQPGIDLASSVEEALGLAGKIAGRDGVDEICVIGGGEIYRSAISMVDRIYLTRVHDTPEGDTYLIAFDRNHWAVVEEKKIPAGEKDTSSSTFQILERIEVQAPKDALS